MTVTSFFNTPTFQFGTKAETLERLTGILTRSTVPRFLYFTVGEYRRSPRAVQARIARQFAGHPIILRSSACGEDGQRWAMAGQYHSVLNIQAESTAQVHEAVEAVIASYLRDRDTENPEDHIIAQLMVDSVCMSGVLFTQDLNTGAPYYVINYDDETGRTDTVTSGSEYSNRTLYVQRGSSACLRSERFRALIDAVEEIESVIGSNSLDVEFCIDDACHVHLLQVRTITTQLNWNRSISLRVHDAIEQIEALVAKRFRPTASAYGRQSVFGQMPDWNPAEMIGRDPRALAMSLYRYLITDRAWREARRQMNYAVPHGVPLMVSLAGQPYIDVRLSFHSYLPADLPAALGHKLVDGWLNRLIQHPHLHDKVEFDVAVTAFAFDFEERVDNQFPDALTAGERSIFRESLRRLTQAFLTGAVAPIDKELAKVERLSLLRTDLLAARQSADISMAASLLEDCIELGTIPFSILARHGFIAQSILKSLVARKVLSDDEATYFRCSVKTVASNFAADVNRMSCGNMSSQEFMKRYGHLRPGTYDVLSPRYDQREKLFEGTTVLASVTGAEQKFQFRGEQLEHVQALLDAEGFEITANQLIDYIERATAAREYAKFVFTRNVSDALEILAAWGEQVGLSRDELSFVDIRDILDTQVAADCDSLERKFRALSEEGRVRHEVASALRLPQLLFDVEGVHVVPLQINQPNFVTQETIQGEVVRLEERATEEIEIHDKIVLIDKADPGFDWIFTHGIRGLITKYGGANSHMTIRCAEFGIPAAIGCGEQIFDRIEQASRVEINCVEEQVRPVDSDMDYVGLADELTREAA